METMIVDWNDCVSFCSVNQLFYNIVNWWKLVSNFNLACIRHVSLHHWTVMYVLLSFYTQTLLLKQHGFANFLIL